MKNILLLLALWLNTAYSQKLIKNEKDEFTGKLVKQTSIEALAAPFKTSGFRYDFSIKRVDSNYFFNLRVTSLSNSSFAVDDGNKFSIKFENGVVVELNNPEYSLSQKGRGSTGLSGSMSEGVSLYMPLSNENINVLAKQRITKVRLYTTSGYSEQNIKENADKKVKSALNLVIN